MTSFGIPGQLQQASENLKRYFDANQRVGRSIESGQIFRAPEKVQEDSSLMSAQKSLSIGEPVPIVFARRINGNGGIFISPGATEARFSSTVQYDVVIQNQNYSINFVLDTSYHLVLSEGLIDSIPVKDIFQGTRRTGTHTQTFSRRAGTWVPGNFVSESPYDSKPTPDCPEICGSVGLYPGISTLSFSVSTFYGRTDSWKQQVHVFVRGGMYVTRLLDSVFGPSNNFADLVKWAMQNIKRISTASIDNTSMLAAAQFLEVNQFTCNAYFTTPIEYESLTAEWGPYFLLQLIRNEGKEGLRPLLPVNADGTINTEPIQWSYTFDEKFIVPDSLEIKYTPLTERLPFIAQMVWRQQPDSDVGITRTLEVNYKGLALDGPYEKHDLSAFCTNENHAAKVGAYIVSTRANVTHTISFTAAPGAHSSTLSGGDIIRVILDRTAYGSAESTFVYLYRIVQIVKDVTGAVTYDCVHFPINSEGQSIVAVDVANAVGTGFLLESRSGLNKDDSLDRKDDGTVPAESYISNGSSSDPSSWGSPNYQWYNNGVAIPGATGPTYTPTTSDIGDTITAESGYPNGDTSTSGPFVIDPEGVGNPLDPGSGDPGGTGSAIGGGGSLTVGSGGNTGAGSGTGGAVTGGGGIGVGAGTGGSSGSSEGGGAGDGSGAGGGAGAGAGVSGSLTITDPAGQPTTNPVVGNTVTAGSICAGGIVTWYRLDPSVPGGKVYLTQGPTYTMVINDANYSVYAEYQCPDPSSPTEYGPSAPLGQTGIVVNVPDLPNGNVYGTYSPTSLTIVSIDAGWTGNSNAFGPCVPNDSQPNGTFGTASVIGVQGFRLVEGPAGVCGGFATLNLQVQNAAGIWTSIAGVGGGSTGWTDFIGNISMSSTAPDAIPAYLGNFGGTSTPP